MAESVITNPQAAYKTVSDYTTGKDDAGEELSYGKTVRKYQASETIAAGKLVALTVPTASVPVTVSVADAVGITVIGVAETGGDAGDLIDVVVEGHALATCGEIGHAGGVAIGPESGGNFVAVTLDATDVVGTLLGFSLAAGDDGDLLPVYISPR